MLTVLASRLSSTHLSFPASVSVASCMMLIVHLTSTRSSISARYSLRDAAWRRGCTAWRCDDAAAAVVHTHIWDVATACLMDSRLIQKVFDSSSSLYYKTSRDAARNTSPAAATACCCSCQPPRRQQPIQRSDRRAWMAVQSHPYYSPATLRRLVYLP